MSGHFYKVLERLEHSASCHTVGVKKEFRMVRADDLRDFVADWKRLDVIVRGGHVNGVKCCPFCGTQPLKQRIGLSEVHAYADRVVYLCPKCGCCRSAVGDTSKGGYADNSKVEALALEQWNMRAGDQA